MEDQIITAHRRYFHPVDYIVFVLMFVISLAIGAFFAIRSRNKNTTDEYLMGGRKLGLLPVTVSLCVSCVSANTLLGAPAEMYTYGIMYEFLCVAIIISTVIVALFYVPLLYPLKITSAHKYLHLRFESKSVQYIGTFLLLLTQILYVGCVIFGPATALETVTGIPPWASIIFVGVIGTAYTAFGGMKAVIWTDVFQSSVMLAGLIAMIAQGSRKLGGFKNIWDRNLQGGRLDVITTADLTERWTLYSSIIGLTAYWVGGYGVNQPCMQRYCAMDTQTKGRLAMLMNGPGFIVFNTLSMMSGMVAFAYYDMKRCDPLKAGLIDNGNQITPYFVMEILGYPGLPGLFVSSLFSASLSQTKTWITKGVSIFFGMLCMAVSFIIMAIGGNLIQIAASLFGMTIGPLLGVFTLGALFPCANWPGAVVGSLSGVGVNIWLMVGQTLNKSQRKRLPTKIDGCFERLMNGTTMFNTTEVPPGDLWSSSPIPPVTSFTNSSLTPTSHTSSSFLQFVYTISFSWYPVIGFLFVIVVGLLVSLVTGCMKQEYVKDKYLFPCLRRCRNRSKHAYSVKDQEVEIQPVERNSSFVYHGNGKSANSAT